MKRNVFKGTLIGILAGAVAGLLLAPKSGKETQADLKNKVKGAADDMNSRLNTLNAEVSGRVDHLKEAARDLKGEAREESQELIRRAEVLKQDLRDSGADLADKGAQGKDEAMKNIKRVMAEGSEVMRELERVTKQLAGSAKTKAKAVKDEPGTPEVHLTRDDVEDELKKRGDL